MKLTVDEAREYFSHPSQHEYGLTEQDLPDWAEYRACGGVCMAFHPSPEPGVWFAHIGVKREAWGDTEAPVRTILGAFRDEVGAARIVAWIPKRKRHAVALARRTGWVLDGEMALPKGGVLMFGWA